MMEMIAAGSAATAIVCAWGWYRCNRLLNKAENLVIHLAIQAGIVQEITIDKEKLH